MSYQKPTNEKLDSGSENDTFKSVSTSTIPAMELREVSREFIQGEETIEALKRVNVKFYEGEMVGILGPSGSGKSTMLTIMGGLRQPTTGEVLLEGKEFSSLPEKQRAKLRLQKLGFVLQASGLVDFLKVQEQMDLFDRVVGRTRNKIRQNQLLDLLGISKLAQKYPQNLSGGERQRVAIATALYHDPKIILADEPTAALHSARAFQVTKLLADLTHTQRKATVMVTHDERLLTQCDRILKIEDGKLSELSA